MSSGSERRVPLGAWPLVGPAAGVATDGIRRRRWPPSARLPERTARGCGAAVELDVHGDGVEWPARCCRCEATGRLDPLAEGAPWWAGLAHMLRL